MTIEVQRGVGAAEVELGAGAQGLVAAHDNLAGIDRDNAGVADEIIAGHVEGAAAIEGVSALGQVGADGQRARSVVDEVQISGAVGQCSVR